MEWREKRLRWIERQREQDRDQADRPWPRKEGNQLIVFYFVL